VSHSKFKFSQEAKEKLGHYVYALVDPRDKEIFYVGKASGNDRAFDHFKPSKEGSSKTQLINEIFDLGLEPRVDIVRHGLETAEIAHEVESALIDCLDPKKLTNQVRGHHVVRGRRNAQEFIRMIGRKPVYVSEVDEPCILVCVTKSFSLDLSEQELYDSIRQSWRVGRNVRESLTPNTVLGVRDGVVIAAYRVAAWFNTGTTVSTRELSYNPDKFEFVGSKLDDHKLVGKLLVDDHGEPLQNFLNLRYIGMP